MTSITQKVQNFRHYQQELIAGHIINHVIKVMFELVVGRSVSRRWRFFNAVGLVTNVLMFVLFPYNFVISLGEACTIVLRGATQQIIDEAERSLHDALCVLAQTVKDTRTVYGGGE